MGVHVYLEIEIGGDNIHFVSLSTASPMEKHKAKECNDGHSILEYSKHA